MKSENYIQDFYVGDIVEFTQKAIDSHSFADSIVEGDMTIVTWVAEGDYGYYPSALEMLDGECEGWSQYIDGRTLPDDDVTQIDFTEWFNIVG